MRINYKAVFAKEIDQATVIYFMACAMYDRVPMGDKAGRTYEERYADVMSVVGHRGYTRPGDIPVDGAGNNPSIAGLKFKDLVHKVCSVYDPHVSSGFDRYQAKYRARRIRAL